VGLTLFYGVQHVPGHYADPINICSYHLTYVNADVRSVALADLLVDYWRFVIVCDDRAVQLCTENNVVF